jgi:hypothetical protein
MLFHSTQVKGSNPEARALMVKANEKWQKKFDKAIFDAMFSSQS